MFRDHGMDAVMLPEMIDSAFMGFLEQKDDRLRFTSIDADLTDELRDKDGAAPEAGDVR